MMNFEEKYEKDVQIMKKQIKHHKNDIWIPDADLKMYKVHTNSWFSICESKQNVNVKFKENKYKVEEHVKIDYKTITIILKPTHPQRNIINNWLNMHIKMYNLAIEYIKTNIDKNKNVLNFYKLRSLLKELKHSLLKRTNTLSHYEDNKKKKKKIKKNYNISIHTLDYAIKNAVSNYKSAITNLKNNNIKHFTISNISKKRKIKNMTIEKDEISKNGFRTRILGNLKGFYNGELFNFEKIKCSCVLQKNKNNYFLYVPVNIAKENNKINSKQKDINIDNKKNIDTNIDADIKIKVKKDIDTNIKSDSKKDIKKKNITYNLTDTLKITKFEKNEKYKDIQITIDPGVRTFCTGITEDKIIKIGENCDDKIKFYLSKKDKILNDSKKYEKTKKKYELKYNKKIKNLVNELHWKTINYLVKNNKTILIGNMSGKSTISKKGKLNKTTKRIIQCLSFYKFTERLKYKCNLYNIQYGKINEWMTSKMCSMCGNIKHDLGSNKKYNCENCKLKIDRDINGARNIHIKSII
jgi:IS605 OrfB family transposase